jgi:hypothetical protein
VKILILHRIPYHKIEYHRGIDHHLHEVTYLGEAAALATLPADLPCRTMACANLTFEACGAALAASGQGEFDRLISLSEYDLLLAAELRGCLKISGPGLAQVELVRDKVKMKAAVQAAGIAVPRYIRGNSAPFIEWSGPTIVKPIAGAASEGVELCETRSEALQLLYRIPIHERSFWELEEFVEGPIYHFDGLVVQGSIFALVASRYVGTCLGYAQGQPLGSIQVPTGEILEPMGVTEWVQQCLAAVAIIEGSFHLEAIATSRGLVFLEVGARVGGADVVACFELATGMHLPSAELKLSVGEPVLPAQDPQYFYGWFVFPSHHLSGERLQIEGVESMCQDSCVIRWYERETTSNASARISYQASEAPLAGVIGAASSTLLERFLTSLFQRTRIVSLSNPPTQRLIA